MVDAAAIAQLREAFEGELSRAASVKDLQIVRDRYLGRKNGLVPALWSGIATAAPDAKRELGRLANELKTYVESELGARKTALDTARPTAPRIFFAIAGPLAVVLGAGASLSGHSTGIANISLYDVFKTSAATFGVVGGVLLFAMVFPNITTALFHRIVNWLEKHRGEKWAKRVEGMRSGIDRMHECVRLYFRTPTGLLQIFVGVLTSGLAHANRLLAGYVAMKALGLPADFTDILIIQVVVSFLLYFAPTPGGAGAAEALSALVMQVYVPLEYLPAYTIIWRFTMSYATVIFGSFVFYKLLRGSINDAESAAEGGAAATA